jgi:hypothetical protein
MNKEEYTGYWWLPTKSEGRRPGKLTIDDTRPPVLTLEGSFEQTVGPELPIYEVVHGEAGGFDLTLVDAIELDMAFRSPRRQTLIARHMLSGGHLAADTRFDELVVEIDQLAEWVAINLIEYDEKPGASGAIESAQVRFRDAPALFSRLDDGTRFELVLFPTREISRGSVTLGQSVALRILPPKAGLPLDRLEDRLAGIVDLVTFLSGRATKVTEATLLTPRLKYKDYTGTARRVHIKWLREWDRTPGGQAPRPTGAVFRLAEVADRWPEIIKRWFTIRKKVGYPLDLLAALAYAPPYHADLRLLLAIQACEGYHQKIFPSRRHEPKAAFEARRAGILASLSEEDQAWLEERINNHPWLIDRLRDLVEKTSEPLVELHASYSGWAEQAKNERNRMSHGDRPTTLTGDEMLKLIDCTLIILSACLVLDMGLSLAECRRVFLNHSRYVRLVGHPKQQ